jgi:hypothetical protein
MLRVRQQYQPLRHGRSPFRFAATVALALLILAGGAAVTVWNTLDVMAELAQQEGRSNTDTAQFRPESTEPSVAAATAGPQDAQAGYRPRPTSTSSQLTTTATSSTARPTATSAPVITAPQSTPMTPLQSSCADGAPAVPLGGQSYCPGYIIGVKQAKYGVGTRIVVSGSVTGVNGSTVSIAGGPGCLPDPSAGPVYCGATIPSMTVSFAGLPTSPSAGDLVRVYGITDVGYLAPAGYVVTGFCAPDFC